MIRKIALFLFLSFSFQFNGFSQENDISVAFVRDFMANHAMKYGELRLIRNWKPKDSLDIKKYLTERMENFTAYKNESVKLTQAEKKYIISKYTSSYAQPWQEKDFEKTVFLEEANTLAYLKANHQNTTLLISHPIFLRKNTIFFISYTNLCCGDVEGYHNEAFYRKVNDKWEIWAYVLQGAY